VLLVLVVRGFQFGTLCGSERNISTKCASEQYRRHFRSFEIYCQGLKRFSKSSDLLSPSCVYSAQKSVQYNPNFTLPHFVFLMILLSFCMVLAKFP
jgi:hypothetical protein